tara:strand:- start:996 stop:1175 length:180 start_codon:yes stop_codon:yes gene_type:complete
MTKLEELKAAYATAYDAAWVAARADADACDAAYADAAVKAAWDAYRAELKKTQGENTDD